MLFQSTHSRGVRLSCCQRPTIDVEFQSTHSRGVRHLEILIIGRNRSFNPRTHEECDNLSGLFSQLPVGFNPRTHEECDFFSFFSNKRCTVFQSTHSRGVRLKATLFLQQIKSFNPRTHEECDIASPHVVPLSEVSIHALTRSATGIYGNKNDGVPVSIHALTRSATYYRYRHQLRF